MPGINKTSPQTHADILRVIGEAQVSGKGLDITKDGTVKVASFGTRAFRVIGEKLKGTAWTDSKVIQVNSKVANKLNEAILSKSANFANHENYGQFKALVDRAATSKDLPSSKAFYQAIRGLRIAIKDVDQSVIRSKPGEITISAPVGNADPFAGKVSKRGGSDVAVGSSQKRELIEAHLKDLAASPTLIKPHEKGVSNRFLYDSTTDGGGNKLANVLDKTQNYLYAIAIDSEGKPHVRIGFEDTADGAKKVAGGRADLLGHPTLTNDLGEGKAVIGGELKYNRDKNGWEIDNNSGRFGLGNVDLKTELGLSSDDVLDYAASKFQNIGLDLVNINKLYG
jgi:hypothetical protein